MENKDERQNRTARAEIEKEQTSREKAKAEIQKKYHDACNEYDEVRKKLLQEKDPKKYEEIHKQACECAKKKYALAEQLRKA